MSRVDVRIESAVEGLEAEEIERVMLRALELEGADLVLSCTVVNDHRIHEVNRRFLDHDWPTDVITFDLRDDGPAVGADHEILDGEVLVSATTARREAAERGHDAGTELLFYCVHGVLHLLGWDDDGAEAREAMLARQGEILAEAGYEIDR